MITKFSLRRNLLPTAALLTLMFSVQANAGIWQDSDTWQDLSAGASALKSQNDSTSEKFTSQKLGLNLDELKYTLNQAPSEHFGASKTQIELPLPYGGFRQYTLYHSPIMEKALSDQYPNIQTYRVVDSVNPENSGRLDLTPDGFHGVMSFEGDTVYIDPIGKTGQYKSYFKSDYMAGVPSSKRASHTCQIHKKKSSKSDNQTSFYKTRNKFTFGSNLRTYRLALATTGEFTQFHGGTKDSTLASLVTAVNRINQIYERELAVKMELIADNSKIIFTDPATDPFSDQDDFGKSLDEVADAIDAQIGLDNYDIGHLLSRGLGGLASFASVCEIDKAEAVSGDEILVTNPEFIELISHEMGHQFGADHTFNGSSGSCDSVTRNAATAFEPGSGTTLMSYAGICGDEDVTKSVSSYFHTGSIKQMSTYIGSATMGAQCGVSTSLNNAVPVPNPGQDGHIPKSTPFILMGSATDADSGDVLSYNWEPIDVGAASGGKAGNIDDGSRAIFRSFPPSSSPNRTIPQISDVLSGTSTFGESLPTTNRDLNFRLTVRDGKGGVAAEPLKLTVSSAAGPFVVTAPAAASWTGNSSQTITWDVANTTAAPISCANVDINLSTDDGQTFATSVIASTPNDGSQSITVPDVATTTGRLRVKCASQPFFAVNSGTISIQASGTGGTNTVPTANADAFTVAQDSASVNFSVLENDTDANGDTLTITDVSNISNGGAVTVNGNLLAYQPVTGFSGTETFTYAISDGNGGTASTQVTVTVTPATPTNTAPVANDDSFTVDQDGTANLEVLTNDTDVEGDTLSIATVSNVSNGGTATISGTTISYQPASGFSGTETFTYTVSDGTNTSAEATVTVSVTAPPPPPPAPAPAPRSGGGGGSFGFGLLMLLGVVRKLKVIRLRSISKIAEV